MNAKHVLIAAATVALIGACDVTPKAKPAREAPPPAPSTRPLTLRPGDKVEIKFPYTPEFNDTQQIRADGLITLQVVGDIKADGMTCGELADKLADGYRSELKYPRPAVILRDSYQRKVYVAGEVEKPGLLDMPTDNMDVFQAVMASGGFKTTFAQTRQVLIVRQEGTKRVGYQLDLEAAMQGGEHEPFYLQPQDVVFVPRTPITNVDNWIDQHISKIIPQTGFILFNAN